MPRVATLQQHPLRVYLRAAESPTTAATAGTMGTIGMHGPWQVG